MDLRSLIEQNKQNYILTPLSRMTNYAVLRFGDLKPHPKVSSHLVIEFDYRFSVISGVMHSCDISRIALLEILSFNKL